MTEIPSNIVDPKANIKKQFNKVEKALYKRLKESFKQIRLHQQGKINLKTIDDVLAELSYKVR
jgi:hypothetical protein